MKIYANFELKEAAKFILHNDVAVTSFPLNPQLGEFAFVKGILYVYSEIDSDRTWFPLTNERLYFTHSQIDNNTTWEIQHDLGTKDIIFFAYDSSDIPMFTNVEFDSTDPENKIKLKFTEAISGRAVIFAAGDKFSGVMNGSGSGSDYILPKASSTVLGGVKIGTGISISPDGTISSGGGSASLDGSTKITGDILPDLASTRSLGSVTYPFKEIHADELMLSANSLYINGNKVLHDESNTIVVSTSLDQDLMLKTTGTGDITITSENTIVTTSKGGIQTDVPSTLNNKTLVFNNQSLNGHIQFTASGGNAQVQFTATDEIDLTAPTIDINGNVDISSNLVVNGNLTVNGTNTSIDTINLEIEDNEIVLNKNEIGAGVTAGKSGFRIKRGSENDALFFFDETDDKFKCGLNGGPYIVVGGTSLNTIFKSNTDTKYTLIKNDYLIADTTVDSFSIMLPNTAVQGDIIYILDAKKSFNTKPLTVERNGLLIEGVAEDIILDITGNEYKFVYISADYGWRII